MPLSAIERSREARKKFKASQPTKVRRKAKARKFTGMAGNTLLDKILKRKQKFNNILMDTIKNFDEKEGNVHKGSEIYKKADISKQVFSNISNGKLPAKDTAVKIAFALEATLQEAEDLLKHAGYFLGDCVKRDMIFKYCFENGITNTSDVNILLKQANEKPLGRVKK